MQKTIVTALALLASTAVALATDLPSKTKTPVSPTTETTQFYVGGNIGGNADKARVYTGGAVAGWNILPILAVEGAYDFGRPKDPMPYTGGNRNYTSTAAVNVVPQYKLPFVDVTAYALGGVGYRWNFTTFATDHSVYNYGGGLKYDFAKNLEVDGRYRRTDAIEAKFRSSSSAEDRLTLGVNYKF
jgi:hypothetical protein